MKKKSQTRVKKSQISQSLKVGQTSENVGKCDRKRKTSKKYLQKDCYKKLQTSEKEWQKVNNK